MRRAPTTRLLALASILCLAASGCSWRPPVVDVIAPAVAQTSRVYAADGTLLTSLHATEDRELIPLSRIPQHLRNAVVAIEDERFWQHKGVDLRAIVRAATADASHGRVVEGGSTITQQYVKNAIVGRDRDVQRKVREASIAYQLERTTTKERILELYLNSVYFGNGAYGVEAAAQEYFGSSASRLSLSQCALLAGIIRSPNATDPVDHPDVALARRRLVLAKMASLGHITPHEATVATAEPLGVGPKDPSQRYPAPYFVERVKRFVLDDPRFGQTPADRRNLLFQGGLRITTTLDLDLQAKAEAAVDKVLSRPERDPSAAIVTLDPKTGAVRALVGGRDFFGGGAEAKFDLATQGRRPAGSSFKPFVLAAALQKGFRLSRVYPAPSRIVIPLGRKASWPVDNYEGSGGGSLSLFEATVKSSNTVFAELIMDVGPQLAVDTAAAMGVRSPLKAFPSAVLGTNDVTPLDMASAYGTLANRGLAVPPHFVEKIATADGRILFKNRADTKRAISAGVAFDVVETLRQVVNRGTGVHARIGRPVAGKTGTGQAWRDAWFVGFTPDLVTSVWVGFPQTQRSMVPPATRMRVTGGSWPAEIWQLYMSAALAETPVTDFPAAPPPTTVPPRPATPAVPRVILPSVIGHPAQSARELLEKAGFRVRLKDLPDAQYPPGYVIASSPAAGSTVRANATVTLSISTPAHYIAVPDVLGTTVAAARSTITATGLGVRIVYEQDSTVDPPPVAGVVWKQNPAPGTMVLSDKSVRISVNP